MENTYAIKGYKMDGLKFECRVGDEGKFEAGIEHVEIGELNLTFEEIAKIIKMFI